MQFPRDVVVTVAAVAIASGFRAALGPALSDRAAFQVYTLAVMICAWHGGRASGLLATGLATGAGVWLFLRPFTGANLRDPGEMTQVLLFVATGTLISLIGGQLRQAHLAARQEASRGRRESEQLTALLESIHEGFEAVDKDFRLTYVNGPAQRIIGCTAEELVGREAWGQFPASLGPEVERQLRQALTNRTPASFEARHEASGRWFAIAAYPFQEGISIVFRDVSRRKKAEGQRERLVADLREALGKLRTLRGLIPICAACKKIRDDQGDWMQLEVYLRDHSGAEFSHGLCPDCAAKALSEVQQTDDVIAG